MTAGYVEALRDDMLDELTAAIGTSGLLRFYDGVRPATGGAATTLLAELTFSATAAPGATGGVWTASAIGSNTAAAGGTPTWARATTSGGGAVSDFSVGGTSSGDDFEFDNTTWVLGGTVAVSSFTITGGNP